MAGVYKLDITENEEELKYLLRTQKTASPALFMREEQKEKFGSAMAQRRKLSVEAISPDR